MLSIKSKAIKAGPKIVALGPTSSIIGEKLKSTKVYIQKNRKVANYASVPLVTEVEAWVIAWLVDVESLKEIDNGQCWFKLGFR